jgi:succinate-semialdehyde dehydrogenase/glutarate-semialdehyde dehydrogenase
VAVGPLVNRSTRDKVESLVDDAVAKGAKVTTGGKRGEGQGYFYEPTVLTDVTPDCDLVWEEIFGPVAAIQTFTDEDAMIEQCNRSEYGLASYIYTGDVGRGLRVAGKLETGMVGLNRGIVSDPAAPFGGVKQSGLGREGSKEGVMEYLETQYVSVVF